MSKKTTKQSIPSIEGFKCAAHENHLADEFDHLRTRGAGGSNEEFNLLPLCRLAHIQRHQKGLRWLSDKYPGVHSFMIDNGWRIDKDGRWRR